MNSERSTLDEVGCVVNVDRSRALVKIQRSKECAGCHGCSFMDQEGDMMAEADNPVGASPGDTVRLETTGTEGKTKAALLLYGFPLLMMLVGAIGSQPLFRSLGRSAEILSVLTGFLFLAASFGLLYLIRRRKPSVRSRIVEILERSQTAQLF